MVTTSVLLSITRGGKSPCLLGKVYPHTAIPTGRSVSRNATCPGRWVSRGNSGSRKQRHDSRPLFRKSVFELDFRPRNDRVNSTEHWHSSPQLFTMSRDGSRDFARFSS